MRLQIKFTLIFLAWICWGALFSNDFAAIKAQTVMTIQDGYNINTSIEVAFSNGPGNLTDWIGIYNEGDDPSINSYLTWLYVSPDYESVVTEGTVTFATGLPTSGNYTIHFFANNNYISLASYDFVVCTTGAACDDGDDCTLNDTLDLTCVCLGELIDENQNGICDADDPIISTQKISYAINEDIMVDFINGLGNEYDWIGIYNEGDDPGINVYLTWLYVSPNYEPGVTEGTVTFPYGLSTLGNYTVHFFADNDYNSLASYDFEVTNCVPPSNIAVEMTDAATALFTWDAMADATLYQVKYRIKGTMPWSTSGTVNTQRNIPNLTVKKYYQYKMRAQCADGTWSAFSDVQLLYTSACDIPTGIASVYLDNVRMRIRWDNNSDEIKTKIRYREIGTTTWYTQNSQAGNNYSYINNLTPYASYEYRVRSNCNGNDWSEYSVIYYHALDLVESRQEEETTIVAATKIYPNPTKDVLYLEFESKNEDVNIIISNNIGQVVRQLNRTYNEGFQKESIDMTSFANGYYFITIQKGDKMESLKLMKVE